MNFVNAEKSSKGKLPVGTLVIEDGKHLLTNDSISGLKVDETHVLALGENEATLLEFPDGVDDHFGSMPHVYPESLGIGLSPQLNQMVKNIQEQKDPNLETIEYQLNKQKDEKLSKFPEKDDDLYDQVKQAVKMPIDFDGAYNNKTTGIKKNLARILFDSSLSKTKKISRMITQKGLAEDSDSAALAESIIKDLRGKHLSNAEIYDKYDYLKDALNSPEQTAHEDKAPEIDVPSNLLDEDNPEDIKKLSDFIEKLKDVSPESSLDLLGKVKTNSEYLKDGLKTLKEHISNSLKKLGSSSEEVKEEVNNSLDRAKTELQFGQELSKSLDGMLKGLKSLFGTDEDEETQEPEEEKKLDKEEISNDSEFDKSLLKSLFDSFGIDSDELFEDNEANGKDILKDMRKSILNQNSKGAQHFSESDVDSLVGKSSELISKAIDEKYPKDIVILLREINYELSDPDYDLAKCWSLLPYYIDKIDKLLEQ